MSIARVQVDVSGEAMTLRDLNCKVGDRELRFVIDPALKSAQSFGLGLFFSKSCLDREVLRYPRDQRACVLTESPISHCYSELDELIRRFPVIYTHQRELIERGAPFAPLMFGTNWVSAIGPAETTVLLEESAAKTANVSFVGSVEHTERGAYAFRREVAAYVHGRGDVACFGKGIRPLPVKGPGIAPYRFSIAMENSASDWYFSEKLVDCILLDAIPIYYGCPSIGGLLDPRGLLTFSSIDELGRVLDAVTPALYAEMLPYSLANKRKLVAERWHNHAGLLQRIAESLPAGLMSGKPVRFSEQLSWRRYVSRVRSRLKMS